MRPHNLTLSSPLGFYLLLLPPGGSDLHSDLVDVRRGDGVRPAGGRLRQRPEGVLQEAGVPAQHAHLHADRPAESRRAAEGDDHLHHRRPRPGRGPQDDRPEGLNLETDVVMDRCFWTLPW